MLRINVCIPTRSKLCYVNEFPADTAKNARLPGTKIVIGFDHDDPVHPSPMNSLYDRPSIIVSTAQREDSLGAKYNRCARAYDADWYVLSMDDVAISTPGWDEVLAKHAALFKDGIGWLYFGREVNGERTPAMIAVSRKVVDTIGFCPEIFPFWFNNLWIDEVATLCGGYGQRVLPLPIAVRYPEGALPEPPRRDVKFWAEIFDLTRPQRIAQAAKLMMLADNGPTTRAVLQAQMTPKCKQFAQSCLRDPAFADAMVKVTEPRDARHERLRQAALAMVNELKAA